MFQSDGINTPITLQWLPWSSITIGLFTDSSVSLCICVSQEITFIINIFHIIIIIIID